MMIAKLIRKNLLFVPVVKRLTNNFELDEEKKAVMVSNLLVVFCADEAAQPAVNTGTLNH
jgi:hypothetical protein